MQTDTYRCSTCLQRVPSDHRHGPPHGFKEHDPGLVSTPVGRVRIRPHSITCYCGYEAQDNSVRAAHEQMNEHLEAKHVWIGATA